MPGRDGKMRPEVRCSRYFFVNFVTNSKNNLYLCIGLLCAGPFVYKRRVLFTTKTRRPRRRLFRQFLSEDAVGKRGQWWEGWTRHIGKAFTKRSV